MTAEDGLFLKAAGQMGYFTMEQAHEFGVSSRMVLHYARTGRFLRAARGVYRFRDYPDPPSDIPVAWLAVARLAGGRAVVSHGTAMYVHQLADVSPRSIDVTVERSQRGLAPPRHPPVRLHTTMAWPLDHEMQLEGGALVTSPARTVLDCAVNRVEGEQLVLAYREARARGWLTDDLLLTKAAARGDRAVARIRTLLAEAAAAESG